MSKPARCVNMCILRKISHLLKISKSCTHLCKLFSLYLQYLVWNHHSACDKCGCLLPTAKCKSHNVCCYCYVVVLCCCYCCYVAGSRTIREKSSHRTIGQLQDNSNLWPNLQPVSSPCDIDSNIKLLITLLVSKWFCILFPSTRLSAEQQKYIKVHTLIFHWHCYCVELQPDLFSLCRMHCWLQHCRGFPLLSKSVPWDPASNSTGQQQPWRSISKHSM